MFTFFGCAIQTVSLVLVLCAIQSASHTPEESLSRLKSSDNCYDEGLHFCIHANGMCYGPREYCPKDGEGKVRQCLPGDQKEALELCKKFLKKEEDLPHSQCEWACESRFDDNQLSLETTCPSRWEHICPANGKCYGPQHFCDEKSRKIKACLPENERVAEQRCEQIKNGEDFPHPQCEWACESWFKGIRHSGSGSSESHSLIAVSIFLGLCLLSNILIPIVLWKQGKLSELFCFCLDQRENNNTLTCRKIIFTLLLVLPFATAIALICKELRMATDSRTSPDDQNPNPNHPESEPLHHGLDVNGTQPIAPPPASHPEQDSRTSPDDQNPNPNHTESEPHHHGLDVNGTQSIAPPPASHPEQDSRTSSDDQNPNPNHPESEPHHHGLDVNGTQPIAPPPASHPEQEDTDDDGADDIETTAFLARIEGQEDYSNSGASQMSLGDGTKGNAIIHSGDSKIIEASDFKESERQRNNRNIDDVGVQPKTPSPRSSTSDHACGAARTVRVDVYH